jgi:hypothetical protein
LKKAAGAKWKDMLTDKCLSWLPKPKEYSSSYKSYFTMKGYYMFREKTLPLMKRYLDEDKIKDVYVKDLSNYEDVYSDEFQIVVSSRKRKRRFDSLYESVLKEIR